MPTENILSSDSETNSGTLRDDTPSLALSDLTKYQERQNFLNDLRDTLLREGIQSLGQLDAKLAQVNAAIQSLS